MSNTATGESLGVTAPRRQTSRWKIAAQISSAVLDSALATSEHDFRRSLAFYQSRSGWGKKNWHGDFRVTRYCEEALSGRVRNHAFSTRKCTFLRSILHRVRDESSACRVPDGG